MPPYTSKRLGIGAWRDRLSYLMAIVIGAWASLKGFPLPDLIGRLPPGVPSDADYLQHLTGELYFLAQPWHWPVLEALRLDAPHGVNIALTDSIPLVAVIVKALHPLLPDVRQGIGPWLGFAWLMQPVAAVYALRGTGERRLVACVAVALMAAAMPTFLFRIGHAALDGHFLLLAALGLYLRATGGAQYPHRALMTLSGLVILVLFIHPYLMAMVAAVAAAAPVTLAARVLIAGSVRERHAWRRPAQAAAIVSVGLAATMLLARGLGYFQQDTDADYGRYSMNLAAPFWPVLSRVAPATTGSLMDATGGQFEGYQYLGAGLIGLLAALLVSTRGRTWLLAACRRHAGLLLATAGLSAYAVSTHVWLLHWSLLDWRVVPPGGAALRASGRLFWPVAYVLLLAGVRGVNLAWPRAAAIVLLAAAALQVFDSSALRATARSRKYLADLPPDTVQIRLDGIVAHYNTVTLEPRLECDADDIPDAMRVIYMAARLDLPVNTMYVARHEPGNNCALPDGDENLTLLSPGSLGVAYGTRRAKQAAIWRQYGMRCGVLANYVLCSTNGSGLVGLAAPADPVVTPIPMAVKLTAAAQGLFTDKLAAGWYGVEKWGVWAATPHPELWIPVPHDNRSLRVTLGLHAPPGVNSRTVSVHAGGITGPVVGKWSVSQQDRTYSFVLPPGSNQLGDTGMIVLLIDCHTVVSIPSDPRRFGIGLTSIRVDPVGPP